MTPTPVSMTASGIANAIAHHTARRVNGRCHLKVGRQARVPGLPSAFAACASVFSYPPEHGVLGLFQALVRRRALRLGIRRNPNGRLLAVLARATTEAERARSPGLMRTRTRLSRRASDFSRTWAADGTAGQPCAP